MGLFLSVSAVKSDSAETVYDAVEKLIQSFEVVTTPVGASEKYDSGRDVALYPSRDGWVIIVWPNFFISNDFPLTSRLAEKLETLVLAVHTYDGDYWEHVAFSSGKEIHSFNSCPGYWEDEPGEEERIAAMNPDPSELARISGISVDLLQPYIVDIDSLEGEVKAFPGDSTDLSDIWVFTDFWGKIGVKYPESEDTIFRSFRMNGKFENKLPSA